MQTRFCDFDPVQLQKQWRRRIKSEERNAILRLYHLLPSTAPIRQRTDIKDILYHSAYIQQNLPPQIPRPMQHHVKTTTVPSASGATATGASNSTLSLSLEAGTSGTTANGSVSMALLKAGREIERERQKRKRLERELQELHLMVQKLAIRGRQRGAAAAVSVNQQEEEQTPQRPKTAYPLAGDGST